MAKTGIHIKRANIGSVEAHNLRTKEYLEGLEKAGKSIYFFEDQSHLNQSWVNPAYEGKSCEQIQEELVELYKEKIGQKPQMQDRVRVNKKTGKEYMVAGWSPIREGVIPIKEDTSLKDFWRVMEFAKEKGLNIIRIDIHHDEGYRNEATGETKYNRHAHIVFDWVDRSTGKTLKLDNKDMSEFQDIVAESLQMERGTRKEETGLKHIDHIEYREKKAEAHTLELEKKISEQEETIEQQGKEIIELQEEAEEVQKSTETAVLRLNDIKVDITTSEQTKAKLEQITNELEEALKPTQERQKKTLGEIKEEHTKRYLWGLVKGATDYEAVADDLWQQQREGESNVVRNDFFDVRKYKEERDRAREEKQSAEKKAKAFEQYAISLKAVIFDIWGEAFKRFVEDVKRVSQDFMMAVGLWKGEVWENKQKGEEYTADKDRALLLINGETIDEREQKWQIKLHRALERGIFAGQSKGWVDHWHKKILGERNREGQERQLQNYLHTLEGIERKQSRGLRR